MKDCIKVSDEEGLIAKVRSDMLSSKKPRCLIQAGHFPLFYNQENAYEAISAWNSFTPYSLEVGAKIGLTLQKADKEVKFVFICDDINYEEHEENSSLGFSAKRDRRRKFYTLHSGKNAFLHSQLEKILRKHSFSVHDVVRHNQGKKGREDCLYFSEKVLRINRAPERTECAKAYRSLLESEEYLNPQRDYLISFVPDMCTSNICNEVLERLPVGLHASHIFMQTDSCFLPITDSKTMWERWGVYYRKDPTMY